MAQHPNTMDAINAAQANPHQNEEPHIHGGPKLYALILGALLFLTVVTVGASMINFGSNMTNVIIAMLIASLKASLVALFFMHLRWDKPMSAIIFCTSLFFLGLFLIGCYTDTIARPPVEPTNLRTGPAGGQTTPVPGSAAPIPGTNPATTQGAHGGDAAGSNRPTVNPSATQPQH